MKRLEVRHFGPIEAGAVEFGDLTLMVGPQATGKSLFLQLVKLLMDAGPISEEMKRFNIRWSEMRDFLELYFGEGMSALVAGDTQLLSDNRKIELERFLKIRRRKEIEVAECVFYTPAQRVMALRDGMTRPFTDYRSGDPFVVREFSQKLHLLVQTEFARRDTLFPQAGLLKAEYRDLIKRHVFSRFDLRTDSQQFQRRIVLRDADGKTLPFLVWSAGQREFVPLLLGLYWLLPSGRVSRRDAFQWAVIEEPEMGLHPNAISVVMLLVLELLHRGYKVCLSTHSPHVLDVVWALQVIQSHRGTESDVRKMFALPSKPNVNTLALNCLKKEYRVFYFQADGHVKDITGLDPGADETAEAGWGGLTEFSGRIGEIVSDVVARNSSPSPAHP
jgi:hypothetical protein